MKKFSLLFLIYIFCFGIFGCSKIDAEILDVKWYNRTSEQYNYNWLCGVQTENIENNLGTLLVFDDSKMPLNLNLGFSGNKEKKFDTQIRIYYDYEPISFKIGKNSDFDFTYNFDMQNNSEYNLDLYLNLEEIATDDNIHKLLVTVTTSKDLHAKDLGFSNSAYGISVVYDLVHTNNYVNNLSVNSSNFLELENFEKISDTIFAPQIFTINSDETFNSEKEFIGISNSEPNYTANNESIKFNAFISSLDANEDFAVLICLNFEPYQLIHIPKFEDSGTFFSEFNLELPKENKEYEFTAYTITNPFEKIIGAEHQFINSSNRFTITKQ